MARIGMSKTATMGITTARRAWRVTAGFMGSCFLKNESDWRFGNENGRKDYPCLNMVTDSELTAVVDIKVGVNHSTSVTFMETLTRILSSAPGVKELFVVTVAGAPQLGVVE